MSETPVFPPLFSGMAVQGALDPMDKARSEAALGCDAGLIVYNNAANALTAAIVFAPEVPLREAMAMLPVYGVGFQNALGALAPPEVAVHLEWDGKLRVNGASCGRLRVDASTDDPEAVPDWLIVGLEVPLTLAAQDPGIIPDATALYEEGCTEVSPVHLLEAWSRHALVWINRWSEDGNKALHEEWRGLAWNLGEDVDLLGKRGTFLGVDEEFGMLLRNESGTDLVPLTRLLESSE